MELKETETLSRQFIEAYVRGDYREVADMLHPRVAVDRVKQGKCAVKENFCCQKEALLRRVYAHMETQEYHLIYTDVKTAMVMGKFLLQKNCGRKKINKHWQLLFLWEKMNHEWKVRGLRAQEEKGGQLCIHSVDGCEYFLREHNICYIEALRSKAYIHCPEQTIPVRLSMGKLLESLSDKFIQVHRSFVVNADYVVGIRRYEIRMSEGICLPVPEKKYKEIKEQLQMRKQFEF